MYLHTQLTRLGFTIEELDFDRKEATYIFKNDIVTIRIRKEFTGKITMNYWEIDKPRELEFSINMMNEEYFIIMYIEDFLKRYI
jgi:hypothetical protein